MPPNNKGSKKNLLNIKVIDNKHVPLNEHTEYEALSEYSANTLTKKKQFFNHLWNDKSSSLKIISNKSLINKNHELIESLKINKDYYIVNEAVES